MKHKQEPTVTTTDATPSDTPEHEESEPIHDTYFGREASLVYFRACQKGDGLRHLVGRAVFKNNYIYKDLNRDDVDMFMSVAHFVSTITRNQRENFADVLFKITKSSGRHQKQSPMFRFKTGDDKDVSIPIPTSKQMLRSQLCEGQFSVYTNLPHPKVRILFDHAYVLPSECIADLMAHGNIDIEAKKTIGHMQSLPHSPLAQNLQAQDSGHDCKIIYLSLWSDDFEPNYSKGNRGSVWLMTLTIQTLKSGNPSMMQVYPIACGPKGKDHQQVTQILLKDINNLKKGDDDLEPHKAMWNGKFNQHVSAHLVCITQDQPERRGFNSLLLGGKGNHGRWGYSVDLQQMADKLPPCAACKQHMESILLDQQWVGHNCGLCNNWMHNPREMSFDPNPAFPKSELPQSGKLPLMSLTYAGLKEAVKKTHNKIVSGNWKKSEAKEYLAYYCINTEAQDNILSCASNCAVRLKAASEGDNAVTEACEDNAAREPHKWKLWEHPPMWDTTLDLQQSTEPCMHLLFLGAEKSITFEIQDWAAMRNKYSSLRRQLEKMNDEVERLHLSWCKVQPYKGEKLGGWVSENFVGFARIAPWAYSCLHFLEDDPPFEPPAGKPIGQWTSEQCKNFLRPRNLSLSGKVKFLRDRVRENEDMPIPPPAGGPTSQIRKLVLTLWFMVSHLMGMEMVDNSQINVAQRLIRIFLTALAQHDKSASLVNTRPVPMYISQYNFMSLLNIPEQLALLHCGRIMTILEANMVMVPIWSSTV